MNRAFCFPSSRRRGAACKGRGPKARNKNKALAIDGLNLLHKQTVLSTSSAASSENSVSCNDRSMTSFSDAYFKSGSQPHTIAALEVPPVVQRFFDTIKQRYTEFLNYMKTPQYKTSIEQQIEVEQKRKSSLENEVQKLEKQISHLRKASLQQLKNRLGEA
ncbi:DOT1L [Acanthosepion pharaonis]|uniref:DOT1L n=1 Tax=Acanthosepion pharaonis TaxID=158019 RepID=A0A812BVN1_ACAPH|nr:DOT1L [Sepia pharaonis]